MQHYRQPKRGRKREKQRKSRRERGRRERLYLNRNGLSQPLMIKAKMSKSQAFFLYIDIPIVPN